uniref:Transmembrane protein 184C family n=1 Tax=Cajanus cajan TaxID=3821 RepID=A0A151R4W0_CAJCA|nr:Transmembrane protein 184C family [Cajanus cajan]
MWPQNLGVDSTGTVSLTVFSASIFVLVALVLSMYLVFEHLGAYNQPEEQKFLIGLILMVPVYALESNSIILSVLSFSYIFFTWIYDFYLLNLLILCFFLFLFLFFKIECNNVLFLSLLDSGAAFNSEVIRECYEAFALYCFERYLIACLGGEEKTIQFMESMSLTDSSIPLIKEAYAYGVVEHPFPLNHFLRDWHLGADFYQSVKIGIVQYMILKLICALLAIILQSFGVYGEGKFEWKYGYPYLALILNFSQTWALYCLVQFYSVTKDKLKPIKPLAKFLTFKSIVFLTWWQSLYYPEEVRDCERSTRTWLGAPNEREKPMKFTHSVRDVVVGSGEIIVDDMKFTVSHVVEPVERGIAKINKTFHQISENVKRHEQRSRNTKDDSYLVPLRSRSPEFTDGHDTMVEGSVSDSGLPSGKRQHLQSKATTTRSRR